MGVLTETEKEQIVEDVKRNYNCRSETQFKEYVEIIAGLRIINKTLGNEWYQKAKVELTNQKKDHSIDEHPITYYLDFHKHEKIVILLNFANFLRNLYGKCNLKEKIQGYVRKEKHTKITTQNFNKLYSELKVASYFTAKGLQIEFLKEKKNKKTPDLKIISKDGSCLLECKRKDDGGITMESLYANIRDANSQLVNSSLPSIIYVDIPIDEKFSVHQKFKQSRLDELYPELKTVHYILVAGEWAMKQVNGEVGRAWTRSYMNSFENKMTEYRLPPTIEDLVRDITPPPVKSLLMD